MRSPACETPSWFSLTPIVENQMDKKMENEMETGIYIGVI